MRIAALSDIHGNLGALEAVLEDLATRGVDQIVLLGDLLSGPLQPRETAARLMRLDCPTIRGNHERQLLAPDRNSMGASDRYAADTITPMQREWLSALPENRWLTPDIFVCHATPANDVECFLDDIHDGEFAPAPLSHIQSRAASCAASLILCGHTHIPRVAYSHHDQTIVNPGSVGIQAYLGHHPVPHRLQLGSPHARYAIVERSVRGWAVDLIVVPYDWESAARLAEEHGRPDWAEPLRTGFLSPAAQG